MIDWENLTSLFHDGTLHSSQLATPATGALPVLSSSTARIALLWLTTPAIEYPGGSRARGLVEHPTSWRSPSPPLPNPPINNHSPIPPLTTRVPGG